MLRDAVETPDETALWFVNGDFYRDHRHQDHGNVLVYALGAPLSVDWGSTNGPRQDGLRMHSVVEPEASLIAKWSSDSLPLTFDPPFSWGKTESPAMSSFSESGSDSARFHWTDPKKDYTWDRRVMSIHADPQMPIFVIDDELGGADAASTVMVSGLNLMAEGAVETPAGPITPPSRTYDQPNKKEELPSLGTPHPLGAGPQKFHFTGQYAIDWDLYSEGDGTREFALGNWGKTFTGSAESAEFVAAMKRPYEERQDIFTTHGGHHARTVILAYRKGARPAKMTLARRGDELVGQVGAASIAIGPAYVRWESGARRMLATYDANAAKGFGASVEGGPSELVLDATTGTLTLSGEKGERHIQLPKGWKLSSHADVHESAGGWVVEFGGGAPLKLTLSK